MTPSARSKGISPHEWLQAEGNAGYVRGPSSRSRIGQSSSPGEGPRPRLASWQGPVLTTYLTSPREPAAPTLLPAELTTPRASTYLSR